MNNVLFTVEALLGKGYCLITLHYNYRGVSTSIEARHHFYLKGPGGVVASLSAINQKIDGSILAGASRI